MRGRCSIHGEVEGVKPNFNWCLFLLLVFVIGFGFIYLIWWAVQSPNRCPICHTELSPIVYNANPTQQSR